MSDLVIPNTLVPRTPQNVSKVQENFDAIEAWSDGGIGTDNIADGGVATADLADLAVTTAKITDANVTDAKLASPNSVVYRTILQGHGGYGPAAAGIYLFSETGDTNLASSGLLGAPQAFQFNAADYTVAGKTTKLNLVAAAAQNATAAAAMTFNVRLYQVTGVAGGAGVVVYSLSNVTGAVVTFAGLSASTVATGTSGDFDIPADGFYAFGVTTTGTTPGANALSHLHAQLRVRHV